MSVCWSVCPRSKRKMAGAINTKLGRLTAHGRTSACTDPEVKRCQSLRSNFLFTVCNGSMACHCQISTSIRLSMCSSLSQFQQSQCDSKKKACIKNKSSLIQMKKFSPQHIHRQLFYGLTVILLINLHQPAVYKWSINCRTFWSRVLLPTYPWRQHLI